MPSLRQRPMFHGPNLRRRGGLGGLYANLWAYWPHEDPTGTTIADIHGGGRDLTGSSSFTSTAGKINNALTYPAGGGNQASVAGAPAGAWSLSGWFDPGGVNNPGECMRVQNGSGHYHAWDITTGTDIRLKAWDGTNFDTQAGFTGSLNYAHYVLTSNGTDLNLYVDGALELTVAASSSLSGPLTIGIYPADGCDWDEVGFWTEEFNLVQVQRLYNGGDGLPYASFG